MSSKITQVLGDFMYEYLGINITNSDEDINNGAGMFKDIADIAIEIALIIAQNPDVYCKVEQEINKYKKDGDK